MTRPRKPRKKPGHETAVQRYIGIGPKRSPVPTHVVAATELSVGPAIIGQSGVLPTPLHSHRVAEGRLLWDRD